MDQFNNHPLYRRHNLDTAMSSLFEFYKKHFLTLFLTSIVMSLVIQYASMSINIKELQSITDPVLMLEKMKEFIVPVLIISLINLLFTTILQYYIIYNPLSNENTILVSALKALKYYIPYLIIMVFLVFFASFAIVLGIIALIVGAFFAVIYVMTLNMFILPIMMIEGPDILKTINRTFKLTHKNFWPNIGWVAVFLIIMIVISVISSAIIVLPFTGNFLKTIANPDAGEALLDYTKNPVFLILSALASAITMPLMPILGCVLYFNGRATEEQQNQSLNTDNQDNGRIRVEDLYAKPYSDDHPENPEKKV